MDQLGPSLPDTGVREAAEEHRARILAAIQHNLSIGLIESTNAKIRLITRIAYGFKSAETLIALALLNLGGHRPALPGRKGPTGVASTP